MDTVLITGASGFLGGCIRRAYARTRGPAAVRCLVRTHAQAQPLKEQGFQVIIGDITDPTCPSCWSMSVTSWCTPQPS